MKLTNPRAVDVQPHDEFEVRQSERTGAWLLYRYRRVSGQAAKVSLLIATYGSRRAALLHRRALREAAQRLAASPEWDDGRQLWTGLEGASA